MPSDSDTKDSQTERRLKMNPDVVLEYRASSPGYWTIVLLPLAVYFGDVKFKSQSMTAVLIILYNSFFMSFLYAMDFNIPKILQKLKSVNILLSVITAICGHLNKGIFYQYVSYIALNFSFPYVFKNVIRSFPNSFSFGEGIIVTSAFTYNFWVASQNLPFPPPNLRETEEPVLISIFVQMAFFGSMLLSRLILLISKPWKFFELEESFGLWAKGCFIAFSFRLTNSADDIWFLSFWLLEFLLGSLSRWIFLGSWTFCVAMAAWFLTSINLERKITSTIDRKYFHVLITFVFLPTILKDFYLIYFCSALVFFAFVLIEAVRATHLQIYTFEIGKMINSAVIRFKDSQDGGVLILTPIYLLAGCSAPIWLTGLYYDSNNNELSPEELLGALSGILSIGIGDTFASVCGSYYGRTKWPGSRKTVEGTVCCCLSQIFFGVLLCLTGALPYNMISMVALCLSALVSSLVEAFTDQIDNLILPLVSFNIVYIVRNSFDFFQR